MIEVFPPQVQPVYTAAVQSIYCCVSNTCTVAVLGASALYKLSKRSKDTHATRL